MNRFAALLCLLLATASPRLWATAGPWRTYLSFHDATDCVAVGEKIYTLFGGNLLVYDTADTEVRTFSPLDGLHGKHISLIGYSARSGCVVLVYENAMIDLLHDDGCLTAIDGLYAGLDNAPSLIDLTVTGRWATLTTSEGVAQIDLEKQEVKGFYATPAENLTTAAVAGDKLYAGSTSGLYACPLLANLSDSRQWSRLTEAGVTHTACLGEKLFFSTSGTGPLARGLWTLAGETPQAVSEGAFDALHPSGQTLLATSGATLRGFTAASAAPAFTLTAGEPLGAVCRTGDGTFWQTTAEGLTRMNRNGDALAPTADVIGGYGPRYDLCYYMTYAGRRLLVAGGRLDPYDRQHYPAAIMTYEDGKWQAFPDEGIAQATGVRYRDITCVLQDPADPDHHWATATSGLYEYRQGRFVKHYTTTNSPLRSAAKSGDRNYVRVDGLTMDAEGNLWMVNNGTAATLHALRPDGTWKSFEVEGIMYAPTLEKTLLDRDGRLWVCSRRTVDNHDSGLLCFDYGGSLRDDTEPESTYRSRATNQDGTTVNLESVYALAEDPDGKIWVGCASGLYVIDDPSEWSRNDFLITQVKVPRNDGTNLADYLLAGVAVTALAVDPIGRKWIGTDQNGLFLVSADGTEILGHFDTSNSPILSNYVQSLVIDGPTGEVMVGTDQGLCAYMGEATTPAATLDESGVRVYPNPFRPEMRGQKITVEGLPADTEVKIMSADGNVVSSGRSTGGTYLWDVTLRSGRRAPSGVYFILLATPDGKETAAAKVVVI